MSILASPAIAEIMSLSQQLSENGFCIMPSVVDPDECARFLHESVVPMIHQHSPYTFDTPASSCGNIPGVMIRQQPGDIDPIQNHDARWPALFQSPRLNQLLDLLHSGDWSWLHDDNIGWIHCRFPAESSSNSDSSTPPATTSAIPSVGWHVDGGHFKTHRINSPEQSYIVLPMIRDVLPGGGATCVLRGSHIHVSQYLLSKGRSGAHHRNLNDFVQHYLVPRAHCLSGTTNFVDCAANAGDVLILHPFVAHAAANAQAGHPWRVTFNMGTQWRRKVAPPLFDFQDEHRARKYVASSNTIVYGIPLKLSFPFAFAPFGTVEKKLLELRRDGQGFLTKDGMSLRFVKCGSGGGAHTVGKPVVVGDRVVIQTLTGDRTFRTPADADGHEFIVQSYESDTSDNIMLTTMTSFFLLDARRGLHVNFNPNKVLDGDDGDEGPPREGGCVVESWRLDKGDWQEIQAQIA
jgi:hypothetical protein